MPILMPVLFFRRDYVRCVSWPGAAQVVSSDIFLLFSEGGLMKGYDVAGSGQIVARGLPAIFRRNPFSMPTTPPCRNTSMASGMAR